MSWLDRLSELYATSQGAGRDSEQGARAVLGAVLPLPTEGAEATFNLPTLAATVKNYGAYVGVPTNARTYMRALAGDRTPLTAEDFSAREIQSIQALAGLADDRKAVTYETYDKLSPQLADRTALVNQSVVLPKPLQQVMTTLGQFRAVPTDSGYRIVDTYDFNPLVRNRAPVDDSIEGFSSLDEAKNSLVAGDFYSFARFLGEAYGPRPGGGMPVDFVVPYPKRSGK